MTAATFSYDGSVLAVAAETVITLWDPEKNVLVAVIGETLTVILKLLMNAIYPMTCICIIQAYAYSGTHMLCFR